MVIKQIQIRRANPHEKVDKSTIYPTVLFSMFSIYSSLRTAAALRSPGWSWWWTAYERSPVVAWPASMSRKEVVSTSTHQSTVWGSSVPPSLLCPLFSVHNLKLLGTWWRSQSRTVWLQASTQPGWWTATNTTMSGEVGRSWRYCNARPTRDKVGASYWTSSPYKNQFNIEGGTWPPYQILSW